MAPALIFLETFSFSVFKLHVDSLSGRGFKINLRPVANFPVLSSHKFSFIPLCLPRSLMAGQAWVTVLREHSPDTAEFSPFTYTYLKFGRLLSPSHAKVMLFI